MYILIKSFFLYGIALFLGVHNTFCQPLHKLHQPTKQDTLRGTITPERAWWNVLKYDINITPDYTSKTINGVVVILFSAITDGEKMQIDLQQPLIVDSIIEKQWQITKNGGNSYFTTICTFNRDSNIVLVNLSGKVKKNTSQQLIVYYHGKPREAVHPPWDGGWIWQKDSNDNPWMSVACQGLGASVWYPCKDHQSDEPDSGAILQVTVPDTLTAVGNGILIEKIKNSNATSTWVWQVVNPINNYNIVPYIGKYNYFTETYRGEKGKLNCSYWVLNDNIEKAKMQFKQVTAMLKCFEYWFGPYPFYADGYKLVEAPYLGMEHQSAIAYGNKFKNGYLGKDLSGTGWGLKWDFIIVHESGHEWFGNNITTKDIADMWVHESFTNYSETLFTENQYGKQAGMDYVIGTRKNIRNDIPIIGTYGVNNEGSGDMYYKGGNMLHMIRQVIDNDSVFRKILRGLNKTFYHQTVTTKEIEDYISAQSGINFSTVFDQYLRTTEVPILEYTLKAGTLTYRWANCVQGFNLPLKVLCKGARWIKPTEKWQTLSIYPKATDSFSVDKNFYIKVKQVQQ